jgi:uncharacterized RDD family membrane protein YckC
VSDAIAGRCSRHPERAGKPCPRCGDYVCDACLTRFDVLQACVACFESVALLAEPSARLGATIANQVAGYVPASFLVGVSVFVVPRDGLLVGLGLALLWGAALLAWNLVLLRRHAQTLGKRWFGVRVLRADGKRPGLARLVLLRELLPIALGLVPFVGFLFGLVDAVLVFSAQRRTLHDLIAGTIVIQVPPVRGLR